jgi:hypothetical protein
MVKPCLCSYLTFDFAWRVQDGIPPIMRHLPQSYFTMPVGCIRKIERVVYQVRLSSCKLYTGFYTSPSSRVARRHKTLYWRSPAKTCAFGRSASETR